MQNMQYQGLGIEPIYGQAPFGYQQYPQYQQQQFQQNSQQQMPQGYFNRPKVDPSVYNEPPTVITLGGETAPANKTVRPRFTIVDENKPDPKHSITVDQLPSAPVEKKPRKKKESVNGIIHADEKPESLSGTVEDPATIYSYGETNHLLHETLGQIDAINAELVQEFNAVRNNRTMKNKYMTLNALSENIGSLLSNRIQAIKEINNCITKANDLDYKKFKDMQAIQSAMNDDKYIADVYQALISNPQNMAPTFTANVDPSVMGSGIIRANLPNGIDMSNGQMLDSGYLNYVSNLTPEQNLMRYENDPNVKQVVVYDASNGNRFFQMMNMATGEAIPNVPVYDENIMEDTTLDLAHGIAKNLNLRETFPVVQINEGITSQY